MFQFPFGTMHQLNLDWFLQQWQELRQDWIDEEQNIEDSMQDVYDARDAAIQAKDDAVQAKNDAEAAESSVEANALKSEGFAVGEQNGTPAGPGDPYYQSNAKFYSINAGTYRYLSEAYARGTMGGTPVDPGDAGYEDNAKYYKDAADLDAQSASADAGFAASNALKAEGYAVGEQNGTPVSSGDPYYQDNAKYYAAEAQQDKEDADTFKAAAQTAALKTEGMTYGTQNGTPVDSSSPYYENNADYFYQNTAGSDGANAQTMIALKELTSTASKRYLIGDYFIYSGKLYKVTVDIANGGTIDPGTNCEEVILCDNVGPTAEYLKKIYPSPELPWDYWGLDYYTNRRDVMIRKMRNILFINGASSTGSYVNFPLFTNDTEVAGSTFPAYTEARYPITDLVPGVVYTIGIENFYPKTVTGTASRQHQIYFMKYNTQTSTGEPWGTFNITSNRMVSNDFTAEENCHYSFVYRIRGQNEPINTAIRITIRRKDATLDRGGAGDLREDLMDDLKEDTDILEKS